MSYRMNKLVMVGVIMTSALFSTQANAEGNLLTKLNEWLHAKPVEKIEPGKIIPQNRTAYLGRAPYICGPSGFGQTSSCFLRASLR